MALKLFGANNNEVIKIDGDKTYKTIVNLFNKLKNDKCKNLTYIPNITAVEKLPFLISNAKKIFNYLNQAFIKAPIP